MTMLRSGKLAGAANDNFLAMSDAPARSEPHQVPTLPSRDTLSGSRTLRLVVIASFSGLVLVGLSSAFLVGLAMVGVLAVGLAGLDLIRRHVVRAGVPTM
jgi:hypothetical protein